MIRMYLHRWDGSTIGELLTSSNRRLSLGLNRISTLSFDVALDASQLSEELVETALDRPSTYIDTDYRFVSVYRSNPYTENDDLIFIGPIIAVQDGASESEMASASITCVDPWWLMDKRIANNSLNAGRQETGLSFTDQQRGAIAKTLIDNSNAIDGNSFIRASSGDQAATDVVTINNWGGYISIAKAIDDLSGGASVDGFDWEISPDLDNDSNGLILGRFKSAPLLGADKTDECIFEYGVGRNNVRSAMRTKSLEFWGNRFTHLSPDNSTYAVSQNNFESNLKFGGWFDEIVEGDLIDLNLRQEWVRLNSQVRSVPRRLYEIKPERTDTVEAPGRIPIPLIDYKCGDLVSARAFWADRLRFDVAIRVYGIDLDWADDGEEVSTLTLTMGDS